MINFIEPERGLSSDQSSPLFWVLDVWRTKVLGVQCLQGLPRFVTKEFCGFPGSSSTSLSLSLLSVLFAFSFRRLSQVNVHLQPWIIEQVVCCTSISRLPGEHPPHKVQKQSLVFAADLADGAFKVEDEGVRLGWVRC